ncbi:MAG: hypothetical protein H6825_12250 [Planctomycetes bacterium]|nr:hypothetical protein [Planctomycetota bacterium]
MPTSVLGALLLALTAILPSGDGSATLLALLPHEGRVFVLDVPSGGALLDALGDGPLAALPLPDDARDGLDRLRTGLGGDLLPTARTLLDGEVAAGLFAVGRRSRLSDATAGRRAWLLASRPRDADAAREQLRQALQLAALAGAELSDGSYRDVSYTRVARDWVVAAVADVLLLAGDDDLLADAVDALLDDGLAPPLVHDPDAGARAELEFHPGLLRDKDVRRLERAPKKLGVPAAAPGASLLLGPLLHALEPGVVVHASLALDADSLRLSADAPAGDDMPRAYAPPDAGARRVPVTDSTLGVLFARRDLSDWWRHREELLDEESQPKLAKFDGTMGLFFSGASLAEDVFAHLGPELALVVDVLDFADTDDVPAVRLPAVCLVAPVDDEASFRPRLEVAFQTFLGVVNTERAKDGEPPFLLDVALAGDVPIRYGRLLSGDAAGQATGDPLPSDYNLRPALAMCEGRLLFGTSVEQVRGLIGSLRSGRGVDRSENLYASVDAGLLRRLAEDDHDVLVAQAMLDDGLDPRAAVARVDGLLAILGLFDGAQVDAELADGRLALRLALRFADATR